MASLFEELIDPITGEVRTGIHRLTWGAFVEAFGFNAHRRRLLRRFALMVTALHLAGCHEIVLGGSFVSTKEEPGDIDGVWIEQGVSLDILADLAESVVLGDGEAMKLAFHAELYNASWVTYRGQEQMSFFATTREGTPRGLIAIDLDTFRVAPML